MTAMRHLMGLLADNTQLQVLCTAAILPSSGCHTARSDHFMDLNYL